MHKRTHTHTHTCMHWHTQLAVFLLLQSFGTCTHTHRTHTPKPHHQQQNMSAASNIPCTVKCCLLACLPCCLITCPELLSPDPTPPPPPPPKNNNPRLLVQPLPEVLSRTDVRVTHPGFHTGGWLPSWPRRWCGDQSRGRMGTVPPGDLGRRHCTPASCGSGPHCVPAAPAGFGPWSLTLGSPSCCLWVKWQQVYCWPVVLLPSSYTLHSHTPTAPHTFFLFLFK